MAKQCAFPAAVLLRWGTELLSAKCRTGGCDVCVWVRAAGTAQCSFLATLLQIQNYMLKGPLAMSKLKSFWWIPHISIATLLLFFASRGGQISHFIFQHEVSKCPLQRLCNCWSFEWRSHFDVLPSAAVECCIVTGLIWHLHGKSGNQAKQEIKHV